MTGKQAILDMAQSAPDDIEREEVHYQLFFATRIEKCQTAKAFSLEEVSPGLVVFGT